MNNKTHKTSVVIIPPENVYSLIQAIRKKHDRQYHRWMPHINLLYPFLPHQDFNLIIEKLIPVCSSIPPFEITFSTFNCFHHRRQNYTIWLAPEPVESLINLQTKLMQIFPGCDNLNEFRVGFNPHLSVGQSYGREKTDDLIKELQQDWKPISFTVSQISLIWRNDPPDDKFRIGGEILLGGR